MVASVNEDEHCEATDVHPQLSSAGCWHFFKHDVSMLLLFTEQVSGLMRRSCEDELLLTYEFLLKDILFYRQTLPCTRATI
jgi:hypothetical protein